MQLYTVSHLVKESNFLIYSIYLDFRLKINCLAANIDANLLANKTKRDPFS